MTPPDTPALFSPSQRAALSAVGFTIWVPKPGVELMILREGNALFTARSYCDRIGILVHKNSRLRNSCLVETETEIRAFVARFTKKP